jgi:putative ABC transport system ATP-binding protein
MVAEGKSNGATAPMIELIDVTKVYRMGSTEVRALDGLSLTIPRGGFWAILGASGSGKSTLLNIIGCLDRPTSGRYLIDGRDVSRLDDNALSEMRLRKLGYIFQSFNLIPQSTVEENIHLPLYYQGWEPEAGFKRARLLAEQVGLGDRLRHRPQELSGGQQQRVAIARSLANDPAILLADEPTGNLDSRTGAEIMSLLAGLNAQGKTIVMVTHEADIAAYAQHRLHMKDGRVERIEGP